MADSNIVAFKRPTRRALTGADRRCCHHVLLLIGRTLAARPVHHPTILALGKQARSIAVALKINPYFYQVRRTSALFSDLEMQIMLDGLEQLIDIARRCHGTARAVAAAKKLREMLLREYWRSVRAS